MLTGWNYIFVFFNIFIKEICLFSTYLLYFLILYLLILFILHLCFPNSKISIFFKERLGIVLLSCLWGGIICFFIICIFCVFVVILKFIFYCCSMIKALFFMIPFIICCLVWCYL